MVHDDEVTEVAAAVELVADGFGTDPCEVLRMIAPEVEPADVVLVAVQLGVCPVHYREVDECTAEGCTAGVDPVTG